MEFRSSQKIDPKFDPLRKNPRFQKLVVGAKRAHFEKPSPRLLTKMSESVRRKEVKSGEFELFFELVAGAGRVRSNLNP
jgi:hypothetical protein